MKKPITLLTLPLLATAYAGTDVWFTPLTESAEVHRAPVEGESSVPAGESSNSAAELVQPWVAPEGLLQKRCVSLRKVEDQVLSFGQSIVRVPGLGTGASMFDMLAYDDTGNYLFIPHETLVGAGASRVNLYDCSSTTIFAGDMLGVGPDGSRWTGDDNWSNDWGAFDPARFTPYGTVWLAEEWSGEGRVMEILNPFADPEDIQYRELHSFANVSHEGINFSEQYDDTVYYIDEDRSGSIYKFVMSEPGNYATGGQTFVLSVDNFINSGGDAAARFDREPNTNLGVERTGEASWVPLTDDNGVPLPGITDPFTYDQANGLIRPGRNAADDVNGTPYGRPEDCEVGVLANGNEVLYFTATSENAVYSVEMIQREIPGRWIRRGRRWLWRPAYTIDKAMVRLFASETATPKNVGFAPTTGELNAPDNLAQDALGNIYIIEDNPNRGHLGGDIWFVRDLDGDGVGESVDHFLSLQVDGAESTGMIWNPVYPEEFAIAVQHPDSTDLGIQPDGLGDAVWLFNLSAIPNEDFYFDLIEAGWSE